MHRLGTRHLGDAELIAGVGPERILGHQLPGRLLRTANIEPALHVDACQLIWLAGAVGGQFLAFAGDVGFVRRPTAS